MIERPCLLVNAIGIKGTASLLAQAPGFEW